MSLSPDPQRPLTSREIASILGLVIGALIEAGRFKGENPTRDIFGFVNWRLEYAEGCCSSKFDLASSHHYVLVAACVINAMIAQHGEPAVEALRFWATPATQAHMAKMLDQVTRHLNLPVVN
jgi:hypothetical protein